MNAKQQLNALFHHIRNNGEYVERDYKTIGGMWTVDTWRDKENHDLRVQLGDEGWTRKVLFPELIAYSTGDGPVVFSKGCEADLNTYYNQILGKK